jgi:hypothetical protein
MSIYSRVFANCCIDLSIQHLWDSVDLVYVLTNVHVCTCDRI